MKSAIETVDALLDVVPDWSELFSELEMYREGIFMELPEQTPMMLQSLSAVVEKRLPDDKNEWDQWHYDVLAVWEKIHKKHARGESHFSLPSFDCYADDQVDDLVDFVDKRRQQHWEISTLAKKACSERGPRNTVRFIVEFLREQPGEPTKLRQ